MAVTTVTPHAGGARPLPANPPELSSKVLLALDLGTTTGWAMALPDGGIVSGTVSFRPSRYDGGGMRYVRFRAWLDGIADDTRGIAAVHFEEVRRHLSTDAAHVHGGLLAMLTAWCEERSIAYQGVPVGTINLSDAAAVPDDQLLGLETQASFLFSDDDKVFKIGLRTSKRYARVTITPAANAGNAFVAGAWILGHPRNAPTPNPPA